MSAVKSIIRRFEETGSLDVTQGGARRATEPVIMEEVAIATVEISASSSSAAVRARLVARSLFIPWATDRMILSKLLNLYLRCISCYS